MTDTIFVQIAAYRDPDLPATLHNLLQKAAHPDRLRFGICLQLAENDPLAWREQAFPESSHRQVKTFTAAESRGACWARSEAQGFYNDEDFLLQIDSHMRAVKHWDELLLQTWNSCNDPKAVLSVYPNGFKQPCQLQTSTLPVMAAKEFDNYGILKFQGISRYKLPEHQPAKPLPNAFIAGGFLFGPGEIVKKVPYDPSLYFYGEEISMSVRLWTHGLNIYSPNQLLLFHLYKSGGPNADESPHHWCDHDDWFQLNQRSLIRVHTLLGSLAAAPISLRPTMEDVDDLKHFWHGSERSLQSFQNWAGVNFNNQSITKDALEGNFTSPPDGLSQEQHPQSDPQPPCTAPAAARWLGLRPPSIHDHKTQEYEQSPETKRR